ncbi:hypothetical protein VPH35_044072 [Triticum aestivum]|uniref:Uncharacterized protein n=1 Tax=Triticum urartu TaxID=4572 RepID=A0A8R7PQE3_TRIUA
MRRDRETAWTEEGRLGVDDAEGFPVLDDDVVHVDGGEVVEVPGERDEVEAAALVELVQRRVLVVALPPQRRQLRLQRRVRRHHLPARRVQQRLPSHRRRPLAPRVLHQAHHTVLEHPHARHGPQPSGRPTYPSTLTFLSA